MDNILLKSFICFSLASILIMIMATCSYAQIMMFKEQPLSFQGKTFTELRTQNKIRDHVAFYDQLSFFEVELDSTNFEQYFKVNDTLYFYRKFENEKILSKGYFKINLDQIYLADTTEFCSYGFYDPTRLHNHYYQPIKINTWEVRDSTGELIKVNFNK